MRRFMNMSRNLALVAMLGAPIGACGKKDPEPAPATQPAVPAGSTEATQKAPTEPEKTTEDKPAEPAKPTGDAPTQPAAVVPTERAALSTASVATIPEGFVALAGTSDFGALFSTVAGMVSKLEGSELPPNALEEFIKSAKEGAGIDLSWLDTSKPLRFAVPDPKAHENGFLLVLAVMADAKLEPTAFPGATAGADGHWAKVDFQGRELWLDLVDGHLVAASDKSFAKDQEAFVKAIIGWTPAAPLVMDSSVANLRKTFAQELSSAKEMAQMLAGMANDPNNPGQGAQIQQMADMGFAVVEGLDRLGFAMDPGGEFPRLAVSLTGSPESPVGKLAAETKERKAAFATATPADAWLAIGYDIPGTGYLSNVDSLVDQITSQSDNPVAPKLNDAEKAELKAKLSRIMELQGSQSASWFRQEGDLPFIFEGLSDSPDGAGLSDALVDVGDFLFSKVWVQMRQMMLSQGLPPDQLPENMKFSDFVGFFNKNAGMMGINLGTSEASSDKGVKGRALEIGINWSKLPMRDEAAMLGKLLGDKIGLGFAGHEKLFGFVFGPDAAKRASGLVEGGAPASTDDAWMMRLSQKPMYFMLRPARVLKVLAANVPDMKEAQPMVDKLADDPLVITGSSDGTTLSFEVQLSAKHIELFSMMNTPKLEPAPEPVKEPAPE
ncbi:MAG TPA: hypothetical protein PK095_11250 [Myxococcota bacterium]|nr:hypothetical protein [Myxococcota bacterium]